MGCHNLATIAVVVAMESVSPRGAPGSRKATGRSCHAGWGLACLVSSARTENTGRGLTHAPCQDESGRWSTTVGKQRHEHCTSCKEQVRVGSPMGHGWRLRPDSQWLYRNHKSVSA